MKITVFQRNNTIALVAGATEENLAEGKVNGWETREWDTNEDCSIIFNILPASPDHPAGLYDADEPYDDAA